MTDVIKVGTEVTDLEMLEMAEQLLDRDGHLHWNCFMIVIGYCPYLACGFTDQDALDALADSGLVNDYIVPVDEVDPENNDYIYAGNESHAFDCADVGTIVIVVQR